MLSIRLRRMGAKKRPFYRIVISDSRSRPTGRFVDDVGYYDPAPDPALVQLDKGKVEAWIAKGAKPSATVRSLLKKA